MINFGSMTREQAMQIPIPKKVHFMDNFAYAFSTECILRSLLKELRLLKACLIYFSLTNNELWYIFKENPDDPLTIDFLFDWFSILVFFSISKQEL